MILGTAGHIDHGKTTLVRALTGVDTDRLPEEKRRGITIELGFAPLVLDGVGTLGVVDVPGHEAFVRTMVAGATGIDLALVVIAADEGVMPQTREHLAILQLLGVRRGVVALTKADLVDAEWLALVEEDVRTAIAEALPDAPILATSAQTGAGIAELRAVLADLARSVPARAADDLFRLPVDRAFSIRGTGTVVTGTVWSGSVARDDTVRILPGDRTARVRGVQGHGAVLDGAAPGMRAAIALSGVEVADVSRGCTLVTDRDWHPTTMARADVTFVPDVDLAIRPRTWFRFHVGTSEVGGRIVARGVAPGVTVSARIVLDAPVLLRAGDRFVIRTSAPLNTIAGGVITDPCPPRRARLWSAGLDALGRLEQMVHESAGQGVDVSTLPVRLGLTPASCRAILAANGACVVAASGRAIDATLFAQFGRELVAAVQSFHAVHPLEPGMPLQGLKGRIRASQLVADAALQSVVTRGKLATSGGAAHTPGWTPTPTAEQASLAQTLLATLTAAGAEPPSVDELSASLGADVSPILRFVERGGAITQVETTRYYATGQLKLLLDKLRLLLAGGAEVGPAELRDGLGLSRKFLIPFLEYCDRQGFTNRLPSGRVWTGP